MKTDLRIKAKALRKNLDMAEISSDLCRLIRECEEYKRAKNVMIFYPMKDEVSLLELLNDDKNFYLPRVKGKELEVCPYKNGDELKISEYKILEPVSKSVIADVLDLVIVPALLADKNGYRLGYGGGYYDRFLGANKKLKSICVLPKELTAESLPHDEFDVKINRIITT